MAEVKKARLFLRRGTDTDRILTTLCEGELGYSTDAFRVVIGDAKTAGGLSVGPMVHVSGGSLGTDFYTKLTQASAFPGKGGYALSGDIAIFPSSTYNNAAGTARQIMPEHATTVMILTGTNAATSTHWVNVNNNIPFGNVSISADDISGNYVSGGTISGPVTLSGGTVHIGGDSTSEQVILSGVTLSAATVPTGELIYPLGLTSAAALTCIDSIYGFGIQTEGSNHGNAGGYLACTSMNTNSAVSAYAYTSSSYNLDGSSAFGNTSGTNVNIGAGTGLNIFTAAGYIGSGGAHANTPLSAAIPAAWAYTSISSKCVAKELVYGITQIQNATEKNNSTLAWTDIESFEFQVYYKHYDDAATFIGYYNHLLKCNVIADWNGSSIKKGSMRGVPNVETVIIPNTYDPSEAGSQCLVLHLGFAARGSIAMSLRSVRLRS